VLNPGVVRGPDGQLYLLARVLSIATILRARGFREMAPSERSTELSALPWQRLVRPARRARILGALRT
jgi:hypothetical protein